MAARYFQPSPHCHSTTLCMTQQQRIDLQRLADKLGAPVSQVLRRALVEKLERELSSFREKETRRAAAK